MGIVKGLRASRMNMTLPNPESYNKILVLSSSLLALTSVSILFGYVIYVENPIAQECFIKLTSITFWDSSRINTLVESFQYFGQGWFEWSTCFGTNFTSQVRFIY